MKKLNLIILLQSMILLGFSQNQVCIELSKNPHTQVAGFDVFNQYTNVFGVHIFATNNVPELKVLHCASVLAEYLDNDENGLVDNELVLNQMLTFNSSMVLFEDENSKSLNYFFDNYDNSWGVQDLYAFEIHPEGSSDEFGFDATLEEVLHLISHFGYGPVYPDQLGEELGSDLALAMNEARGGYFPFVPEMYPDSSWYHYDDETCDYFCQITEYFYWALTSLLGAQNYGDRCNDIADEWELCTPEELESNDIMVSTLLANPEFILPTVLPDGNYCPDTHVSYGHETNFRILSENPVRDELIIESDMNQELQFISNNGSILRIVVLKKGSNSVNVQGLSSGQYYLKNETYSLSIMKF